MYAVVVHLSFAFAAGHRPWGAVVKTTGIGILVALCITFLFMCSIKIYSRWAIPSDVITQGAVAMIFLGLALCTAAWAVFMLASERFARKRFCNFFEKEGRVPS